MATHSTTRLEAFSDGVFAIALTLLIIEVKAPHLPHEASESDMWTAIKALLPSIYAFVLSFGIILVTWVNHHQAMRFVNRLSMPFIYANGFMLLSVVVMPFPTALLGNSIGTDHAAPAVVLYSAMHVIQAVAWALFSRTAVWPIPLGDGKAAIATAWKAEVASYFAMVFYTACAIVAIWFPHVIAAVITGVWIFWLIYGIRLKMEHPERHAP